MHPKESIVVITLPASACGLILLLVSISLNTMRTMTWKSGDGTEVSGKVPASIAWVVDAIGLDLTASLFLNCGGRTLQFADNPRQQGWLADTIGLEAATKLHRAYEGGAVRWRMPSANRFLARYLRARDLSVVAIAGILHLSDVAVREHLRTDDDIRTRINKQPRTRNYPNSRHD